jgi:hypothetical protein
MIACRWPGRSVTPPIFRFKTLANHSQLRQINVVNGMMKSHKLFDGQGVVTWHEKTIWFQSNGLSSTSLPSEARQ